MGLGWNSPAPSEREVSTLPPLPEQQPLLNVAPPAGAVPAFLPPAKTVATETVPSTTNVVPAAGGSCLPDQQQWRERIEEQTTQLQQQTKLLQQDLTSHREQLQQVRQELTASREEIRQLKEAVAYWQAEVKRLEGESQAQQQADLKSLEELSASLGRLLGAQRTRRGESQK
jgi:septal ring factor EnvC (AmiA/AmiB activator)